MIKKKNSLKIETNNDGSMSISISFGLYSKNAILKACYKNLDDAHVKVATIKKHFSVEVLSKNQKIETSKIITQICDDLIDFELRETIALQTKEIRTALVERAFSTPYIA